MNKQARLDALCKRIEVDDVCPELAKSAQRLVFGGDNVDAAVMFIGEAPGRHEDETGQSFVGASGKLLDEMLQSIGLKRSDTYITNIVKYRPPGNRDPRPAEKAAFLPYLIEQIQIIQPKVVVTLGRHSGQVFSPDLCIGDDHGVAFTVSVSHGGTIIKGNAPHNRGKNTDGTQVSILPLYHPAAAIYNRKLRDTLFTDFRQIRKFIKDDKNTI